MASSFIFATLDGTISAWPGLNKNLATLVVDNSASKASYTGLAITSNASGNFLYAADNANNQIDMFDGNFNLVQSFGDPSIPSTFSVFGVQDINGMVYVTYAVPNVGAGGYVDVFKEDGTFVKTLIQGLPLNQAWGVALAPSNFGPLSNTLLVSNNSVDGTINGFDPKTGRVCGYDQGRAREADCPQQPVGNRVRRRNHKQWGDKPIVRHRGAGDWHGRIGRHVCVDRVQSTPWLWWVGWPGVGPARTARGLAGWGIGGVRGGGRQFGRCACGCTPAFGSCADGGDFAVCAIGGVRARRKAILSLRLRLHSGLRQSGRGLGCRRCLGLRPRLVYVGPLALGVLRGRWGAWRGGRLAACGRGGRQFCRCACGFTPAFGRVEGPSASVMPKAEALGYLEALGLRQSGPIHRARCRAMVGTRLDRKGKDLTELFFNIFWTVGILAI